MGIRCRREHVQGQRHTIFASIDHILLARERWLGREQEQGRHEEDQRHEQSETASHEWHLQEKESAGQRRLLGMSKLSTCWPGWMSTCSGVLAGLLYSGGTRDAFPL